MAINESNLAVDYFVQMPWEESRCSPASRAIPVHKQAIAQSRQKVNHNLAR